MKWRRAKEIIVSTKTYLYNLSYWRLFDKVKRIIRVKGVEGVKGFSRTKSLIELIMKEINQIVLEKLWFCGLRKTRTKFLHNLHVDRKVRQKWRRAVLTWILVALLSKSCQIVENSVTNDNVENRIKWNLEISAPKHRNTYSIWILHRQRRLRAGKEDP